jgi:hypothetical protein
MVGTRPLLGTLVLLATLGMPSPASALTTCPDRQAQSTLPGDRICHSVARDGRVAARPGRYLLAQLSFDCFDRCLNEFKACLGIPPRRDPPTTLPNGNGRVPTPPPFEICKRGLDECNAACEPPTPRR